MEQKLEKIRTQEFFKVDISHVGHFATYDKLLAFIQKLGKIFERILLKIVL